MPLVSRFRSSPEFAARSVANFGIEGHQQRYDSSAALNPKFAIGLAAIGRELRVRGTSFLAAFFVATVWVGELDLVGDGLTEDLISPWCRAGSPESWEGKPCVVPLRIQTAVPRRDEQWRR